MDALAVLALLAGGVVAVAVALDVFFTVIHPDIEGPIARFVQRGVWEAFAGAARGWRARRRGILAMAGPAIIATTFFVWVALFILGFALMFYSGFAWYRSEPELGGLTFVDALYFSGITVTVLGYGDITPLHGAYKVLSFVASGSGFALLTGAVTYLIEVTSSVDERSRFALRVQDESGGQAQGVGFVLSGMESGDVSYLRSRLEDLAAHVRLVQDKAHRYAMVALYYRSRNPVYDFEPAVRLTAEAAAAAHVLTQDPVWAGAAPSVRHLEAGVSRLMRTVAEQYLGDDTAERVRRAPATEADHELLHRVAEHLRGAGANVNGGTVDPALRLAARSRVFLRGMDRITAWTEESKAALAVPERL
ncbi:MAG TPA: potassium channel family protein [Egibacteraceae bacterium]|nr:potassium channel family protein [Egibacteraceae bacterium]